MCRRADFQSVQFAEMRITLLDLRMTNLTNEVPR